uniref:Replicase polyprotein n=1 Tax=Citrus vein enation virus TaxID=1301220 RepID=A0A292GN90_9VIRU|nr:replicase polyprotein [Citrus vein enation virus]
MIKECLATMSSPTTTFSLSTLLTGWELAYLLSLIMLGWAVLHRRERHARNQLAWRFPTSYYVLLLCYGVTLVAAGGVAGSRLRPSLCHAGSTSLGLPISCGTLEFVPLESGLSSPNLTGGMMDVGRSPSLTVRYSPLFHVGSWLQVARQNTTVRVTLRLSFSYLVTAQNILSGWKRSGLAGMSLLLGCLEPIRMLPAYSVYCLTEALLLTAKCLENAILSWMLLLASALWQLARINPLRTAIWMIVLSLGSFAYENRICRAMIQIILAPVYILPSLGLKFLRVVSILPTLLLNWTKNLLIFWLTFTSMMTRRILVGSLMMVRVILRIPLLPIILMKKILGILMMMTPSVETPVADPRLRFVNRERSVSLEGQARQVCLPAVPPKGVIGKVLNANNIQIGYFSCVKLMGGTDGIMVPIHVYEDAHMFMGNNLALSKDAFTVMYRDVEGDVLILKGPPNYRVVLGVKPRLLLTANFARLGFHSLYFERDGQWKVQSANVKGAEDGFLAVVSQTLPGDSGLPLFDTKHRICAMHIGHYGEKRPENMATVVLPIRGFSVPDTEVFKPQVKTTESLYEDDKIFDLVEDLEKEIDEGVVRDLEFEGQHYKTVIGKTSIALLKEAEFLDHMKQVGRDAVKGKQPWSNWLDDEEDERECLRPITDTKSKYQQPFKLRAPVRSGKTKAAGRCLHLGNEDCCWCRCLPGTPTQRIQNSLHQGGSKAAGKVEARRKVRSDESRGSSGQTCRGKPKEEKFPKGKESSTSCSERTSIRENGGGIQTGGQEVGRTCEGSAEEECAQGTTSLEVLFDGFYHWLPELCGSSEKAWEQVAQYERPHQPDERSDGGTPLHNDERRVNLPGFCKVGSCDFTKWKSPTKELSEWGFHRAQASTLLQACQESYGWPDTGAEAELSSLRYQAAKRAAAQTKALTPSKAARWSVIQRTCVAYGVTRRHAPRWTRTMNRADARFYFCEAVRSLKPDSGSGLPFAAFYNRTTHSDWCYDDASFEALFDLVWARLGRLHSGSFRNPVQAVQDGLCDPIRLFVKLEPHKRAKIEQKRFRLIASVSLADQLVARMLFQEQNQAELDMYMYIPSKPGLGFSKDSQVLEFTKSIAYLAHTTPEDLVNNWSEHLIPTDCSGFDWSVPMWLLEDDLAVRNELTINCSDDLIKMRSEWLRCLGQSVLVLSNGMMVAQLEPGIQKSGSFNTSSTNSRMRYMASLYAGASWAVTMGDDALESVDSDLSQYALLGLICERAEEFDFCSHIFKAPSVVVPKNIHKMIFGLLSGVSPISPVQEARIQWLQAFQSISEEMRHMPAEFWEEFRAAIGILGDGW